MAKTATGYANENNIPLFYISTAFVYNGSSLPRRNAYEQDKALAEEIIRKECPHATIIRPSILTGATTTGGVRHRTGYHLALRLLRETLKNSESASIPLPHKTSENCNILPIDTAAHAIVDAITSDERGTLFVSNPKPPNSDWLIRTCVRLMETMEGTQDVPPANRSPRKISGTEESVHDTLRLLSPYWMGNNIFPHTIIRESDVTIDEQYISKIIFYALQRNWL